MSKATIITVMIGTLLLAACSESIEDRGPSVSSGSDATSDTKSANETPAEEPTEKPAEVSYLPSPKPAGWQAPNRVKVQHILIGVAGSPLPKPNLPTEAEARKLARSLCDRIRAGEDMDALVKEHTHDSHPGIYTMIMTGREDRRALIFMRQNMARAFGDVAYALDVGECAVADYDPKQNPRESRSPYGFHVIKRLE